MREVTIPDVSAGGVASRVVRYFLLSSANTVATCRPGLPVLKNRAQKVCAGGDPHTQTQHPADLGSHGDGVQIVDVRYMVDQGGVYHGGDEIVSDALNAVRPGNSAAGKQRGCIRLHGNGTALSGLFQPPGGSHQGTAGADACHEVRDAGSCRRISTPVVR